MPAKFRLGQLVATPGVLDVFEPEEQMACLKRHQAGDWGDLCAEDKAENDAAVKRGSGRILSSYMFGDRKLWIISESDRSATTLLLPDEY